MLTAIDLRDIKLLSFSKTFDKFEEPPIWPIAACWLSYIVIRI